MLIFNSSRGVTHRKYNDAAGSPSEGPRDQQPGNKPTNVFLDSEGNNTHRTSRLRQQFSLDVLSLNFLKKKPYLFKKLYFIEL